MSKQVHCVNIDPEIQHETGLPTGIIILLLTLLLLVELTSSFLTNAGHTYTVQELVKEVTLKNHGNNGLALLHGIKLSPKGVY